HTNDPYTDMPHHGFGTYSQNQKGDMDFKMNVMLSLETGMKWKLKSNNKWFLYTGLFLDYGLSNIRKSSSRERDFTSFFQYNPATPGNYTVNPLIDANYNNASQSFVDKVKTVAFGVKVQLTFGANPFYSKKAKVSKIVEEKPYEGLTAAQMEDIMNRGTNKLIDAQHKEFEALRAMLEKEAPDFTGCVAGFDLNRYEILPFMYAELDRKVEVMRQYPQINVRLVGHTDDIGTDQLNQQLGLDRAQAVKAYLVSKGISPSRIETASKGKREPFISNTDDGRRRSNRRVDIVLINK
ncbi:MAG: OmpA family protein, partial [Dysgonomonas sp.]